MNPNFSDMLLSFVIPTPVVTDKEKRRIIMQMERAFGNSLTDEEFYRALHDIRDALLEARLFVSVWDGLIDGEYTLSRSDDGELVVTLAREDFANLFSFREYVLPEDFSIELN